MSSEFNLLLRNRERQTGNDDKCIKYSLKRKAISRVFRSRRTLNFYNLGHLSVNAVTPPDGRCSNRITEMVRHIIY